MITGRLVEDGCLIGGLYSEIALKFKWKQSKNCTVTHKIILYFCICKRTKLRVPNDCSQKVSHYIAVCVVHCSLGLDFLGPYRQSTFMAEVLERSTSSRRISVKASFQLWTSPVDFETQICLRICGLFSEFYVTLTKVSQRLTTIHLPTFSGSNAWDFRLAKIVIFENVPATS